MSEQLIFNFPFKKSYLSQDFYVAKNNFNAFKLIESWPNWPSRFINIFGPNGCGKTHLANILMSKIQCLLISGKKVNEKILDKFKTKECLIIDDFENDIEEKLLYSIINLTSQDNKYSFPLNLMFIFAICLSHPSNYQFLGLIHQSFRKFLFLFLF